MPLLRNDAFVADDWAAYADDVVLVEGGKVIVTSARLIRDWDSLAKFTGLLGVSLANSERVEVLIPYISQLSLVVLNFPSYTDGRAYSQAKDLRLAGYCGALRATGNLLLDQFQYMNQMGFDSFEVSERFSLTQWQAASRQMSLAYQRGLTRLGMETEVWTERHLDLNAGEKQPHAS